MSGGLLDDAALVASAHGAIAGSLKLRPRDCSVSFRTVAGDVVMTLAELDEAAAVLRASAPAVAPYQEPVSYQAVLPNPRSTT